MELRHLRYFCAVADCNGFNRAARALHSSQSSITTQIRDLEREIGCEAAQSHAVARDTNRSAGGRLRLHNLADERFIVCDRDIAPTFFGKTLRSALRPASHRKLLRRQTWCPVCLPWWR
jgi:hypothetical protein